MPFQKALLPIRQLNEMTRAAKMLGPVLPNKSNGSYCVLWNDETSACCLHRKCPAMIISYD